MFELIKDKNTIYACISYPFMETWRHEGASGKRIWFTAVHDIEITLNKLIEWENISITE
ncbi:MAG: hypothetical protein JJE45_07955 [Prolixibacteraceae bacterium]|nr:hypothetical protein [Prolixibacteraceae bacterium]